MPNSRYLTQPKASNLTLKLNCVADKLSQKSHWPYYIPPSTQKQYPKQHGYTHFPLHRHFTLEPFLISKAQTDKT